MVGGWSIIEYDFVMQTTALGDRQPILTNFSSTSLSIMGIKVPANNE
jgi:hypothetical protein